MPENALLTAIRRINALEKKVRNLETIQNGHTLGDVLASALMFPELRGLWPFSSVNESGNALDLSGQGRTLTNNNAAPRSVLATGAPYATLNGSTQYFSRADEAGLDITGALTFCGWFYFSSVPANGSGLVAKWLPPSGLAYALVVSSAGGNTFYVSNNGSSTVSVIGSASVVVGAWNFCCCRYTPSTEIAVFTNGNKLTNTTGVPASLYNSSSVFTIGVLDNEAPAPNSYVDGNVGVGILCASALSDALINRWFNMSRPFFGV